MMPSGASFRTVSSGTLKGWISQYTCCSRTRRAMSCVYWLPKSRTRIMRPPPFPASSGRWRLLEPIVRCFLGDDDVVRVAFAHAGGTDAEEACLGAKLLERTAPAVAHAGL